MTLPEPCGAKKIDWAHHRCSRPAGHMDSHYCDCGGQVQYWPNEPEPEPAEESVQ